MSEEVSDVDVIDAPNTRRRWIDPWGDQPLWVSVAAWVGVLAPIVAAGIWAVRQSFLAGLDRGVMELQVMDVFTSNTPLVGVYSRFGWHHPGPWPLWIMAVPYRVVGSSHGLLVAAVVTNLIAAVLLVAVIRRSLPSWAGLASFAALLVVLHSFGPAGLADPWNPYIAILPGLLGAVAATFASERIWFGLVAIAAAAFAAQSHAGFVPGMAVATSMALLWLLRPMFRRERPTRAMLLRLLAVVAVVLVAWGPVIVEQFVNHPGNVSLMIEDAKDPSRHQDFDGRPMARVTFDETIDLIAQQFSPDSAFLTHTPHTGEYDEVLGGSRWWLLVPLMFVVVGVACWRRGSHVARRYLAASWIQLVVAMFATSRLVGLVFPYQLMFWTVAVFLLVTATFWIAGSALFRTARPGAVVRALSLVAIAVLATTTIRDLGHASLGEQRQSEVMKALWTPTLHRLESMGIDEVSIDPGPSPWLDTALGIGLRRAGISSKNDGSARCTLAIRPLGEPVPEGWEVWSTWVVPDDDEVDGGLLRKFFEDRGSEALLAGPGCR